MELSVQESIKHLEDLVGEFEHFDTTVLIKSNGRIRPLRISRYKDLFAVQTRKRDECADLKSAFATISNLWSDGDLLIDCFTVRISDEEYLTPDDAIYKLARTAWTTGLPSYRVVSSRVSNDALVADFNQELMLADQFQCNVFVESNGQLKELELTSYLKVPEDGRGALAAANRNIHVYLRDAPFSYSGISHRVANADGVLKSVEYLLDGGKFLLDTLAVLTDELSGGPISIAKMNMDNSIFQKTRAFLCVCSGIQISGGVCGDTVDKVRLTELSKRLTLYLTSGADGVSIWNGLADKTKLAVSLEKSSLSQQKLSGLNLGALNFSGSDFESSQLKKLQASSTTLADCNFKKADLSDSTFTNVIASGANFSDANLKKCKFHQTDLRNANFKNANVSGADFKASDLRGVDLAACNAAEAKGFAKAFYDDHTILPSSGFEQCLAQMVWKGEGPDPFKMGLMQKQKSESQTHLDFAGFMELINKDYDSARISKAISMLKKSTFELFSEQNASGVVGIVKSQTDKDLVYACKLGAEGTFACCTQNLAPCGGLRGALCKHLLVLIIGLAKSGEIDSDEAAHRVIASKKQAPTLNKDAMANVFLRYQGATIGEIDWRPTETIPEDYYAF